MNSEELLRENAALRERLSRQSQATLRINESLDFDTVLQEVLDSARALTASVIGVDTEFVSHNIRVLCQCRLFTSAVPDLGKRNPAGYGRML